eukprot:COSAG03_NODE_1426_length_4101_cov_3.906797_2_plen_165_part_00
MRWSPKTLIRCGPSVSPALCEKAAGRWLALADLRRRAQPRGHRTPPRPRRASITIPSVPWRGLRLRATVTRAIRCTVLSTHRCAESSRRRGATASNCQDAVLFQTSGQASLLAAVVPRPLHAQPARALLAVPTRSQRGARERSRAGSGPHQNERMLRESTGLEL